ncbi:MAG: pitrilysin family protein [Phycisphaerae bacterium]
MLVTHAEHTLPNGLRVVCESMPQVRSVALGFLVRTGSRHEAAHEHGVSHFLEHMCFKGTATRSSNDINVRFDELGSIYNAFTGKEHTIYYGWVPAMRSGEQLDLLADMIRPAIPPDDFETERKVILEEIAMSDDSFDRHVSNFLHAAVFEGHPLAHEILGEKETIERLPREGMLDYLSRRYAAENTVLVCAGAIEPEALFAAVGRACEGWRRSTHGAARTMKPEVKLTGVRRLKLGQFKQQAVVRLFPSIPLDHADGEVVEAFTALFGGPNSRCYWNIVQKGICSHAGAAWLAYADCGLMALYADGEPERCEEMLKALDQQAREVSAKGFRPDEVARVRNRRRTQLALEAENPRSRLMQMVEDIETYGRVRTVESCMAEVEALTPRLIASHLERFPITGDGMLLSIGPREWP